MKKVMLVTNHSYMFWRFRKELVVELMKKYDVVLLTPFVGHEDDFIGLGLRCIETSMDRRGVNPFKDFSLLKLYDKILRQECPDVVVTYSIKPNVYAGLCCRLLHIPYFANVQGLGTAFEVPGLCSFVSKLYKVALKDVLGVFFENEKDALVFTDRKIVDGSLVHVLNGAGVNVDSFSYCDFPENDLVHFLFVGRFMREKGLDELIEAAKRLHDECGGFVLDLVGFCEDAYEEKIDELVRLGVALNHGFQSCVKSFYDGADCVVLPSYHEGMSNVLLEGASVGRPLITCDVPGCKEVVEDGVTGFLVKVADSESLYLAMKRFLGLSLDERCRMGSLGREKMCMEFKKEKVVGDTLRILESFNW